MFNHSIPKNPLFNSDLKHFNLFLYHLLHTLLSKSKIPEISQSKPSLLNPCFSLTEMNLFIGYAHHTKPQLVFGLLCRYVLSIYRLIKYFIIALERVKVTILCWFSELNFWESRTKAKKNQPRKPTIKKICPYI